jgi:tetratricopeptide (TPR) repeat protein
MKRSVTTTLYFCAAISLCAGLLSAQVNGEFRTMDPVSIALDKAWENFQEGNIDNAMEAVNNVLAKEKMNPRAWYYLGLCQYENKQYKQAYEALAQAIKLYPEALNNSYDTRMKNYTMAKERERAYKAELRELEATLAVTDSCRSRPLRNRINFVNNKLAELQTLEEPKRNEKIPGDYYFHLGNALLKLKQINYAHDAYQMALISDPDNGDAHHNLAVINYMVKRYDLARQHLEKAKALGVKINSNFEVQLAVNLK